MVTPSILIQHCAPSTQAGSRWGDVHFAASLATAFNRAGLPATSKSFDAVTEQDSLYSIFIHLRGLRRSPHRRPGLNVLWIISHAEDVTDDELADFDAIFVASQRYAELLRARTTRPVHVLLQATDVHRFHPVEPADPTAAASIVVVGSYRWPGRVSTQWLRDLDIDFSLYGANWARSDERRFVVNEYVPNDRLAGIYCSAEMVVADQLPQMAIDGFIANRIFDVLASGGFVISTPVSGLAELFGELVPQYRSRDELERIISRYRRSPGERIANSVRAMSIVHEEHTFDQRVATILGALAGLG